MVGQQTILAPAGQIAPMAMAHALRDLLGERLAAVTVGIGDAGELTAWVRGDIAPPPAAEQRLRHAYEIAHLLLQYEEPDSVRAWFMGSEPRLDDQAPALVLGKDPAAVAEAARAFLANG